MEKSMLLEVYHGFRPSVVIIRNWPARQPKGIFPMKPSCWP